MKWFVDADFIGVDGELSIKSHAPAPRCSRDGDIASRVFQIDEVTTGWT